MKTTPSINTVTFYEGQAPLAALRERLESVVRANPWLAGRLISAGDGAVSVRAGWGLLRRTYQCLKLTCGQVPPPLSSWFALEESH